ncbi:hypothetical protein [Acidovorax sp. 69]|uniref:hypothetical protein n=1 Tax=Acidovorax sp. 69 TaxID=2035202 RepID=UPI0012FE3966|nr:hypothetical protein [Acidovorax sp. 69]
MAFRTEGVAACGALMGFVCDHVRANEGCHEQSPTVFQCILVKVEERMAVRMVDELGYTACADQRVGALNKL